MDPFNHFRTIEELTKTLSKENELLSQMFDKRKLLKLSPALALDLVNVNEEISVLSVQEWINTPTNPDGYRHKLDR